MLIPHWKKRQTPRWRLALRELWLMATRALGACRSWFLRRRLQSETRSLLQSANAESLLDAFNLHLALLQRLTQAQEKLAGIQRPSPADSAEMTIDEFTPEPEADESTGLDAVEAEAEAEEEAPDGGRQHSGVESF